MSESQTNLDPQRLRRKSGRNATTIYDVAERAGVNPSTVSRALGKPGRVSAKTEARIRLAAEELNFRMNPFARALPTGKTHTLSLVVADITNPMVFGLVRGAEKAASAAGYALVIAESQESDETEAGVIEQIMPSVDGIVLATTRLAGESIAEIAAKKPIILINRFVEGVPSIVPDVDMGVRALVSHLDDLGHRSIAYLGGPKFSWISARRLEVLMDIADERGIAVMEVGSGQPTLEGGRGLFRRVRASKATSVIAFNDLMAMGLIQASHEAGVSVPGQLSVAGFDDIFGSDLITPALTTVKAPLVEVGERAVRRLLAGLAAGSPDAVEGSLPTELVVRASTGPPTLS